MQKAWKGASKVDLEDRNSLCAATGSNPVSEGRRALLHRIHTKAGWWGGSRTGRRAALTHARRVIDAGDVTKFGSRPGPAAGARRR